jgi:DNA adenine methylase
MGSFDDLKKASAFFVFNRITFSGTTEAGGFSEQAFQKRFTESSIQRLGLLKNVVKNTKITNLDYEDVVKYEGENAFIFLQQNQHFMANSMNITSEYQQLKKLMILCSNL